MIMWCEKLPNGKVRYVERYVHPITEKEGKVSVTLNKDTAANRKNAQISLQAKIDAKMVELSAPTKKAEITLSELAKLYLKEQSKNVKKSTHGRNAIAINKIVEYLGGDSIVKKLNAVYVKKHLYIGAKKPCTKNERLKRFKAMIRWGYEEELIADISWLSKLKPFEDKEKKEKLEDKFLESDELRLVLENMEIPKWKFLTELTALSGMRFGEAIALETSDIHFDEEYINVDKNRDYIHDVTTTPKTDDSTREIPMQGQLKDLCKRIRIFMNQERMRTGCRTTLFMSNEDGEYLEYAAYNKYLKTVTEKVIGKKATTHFMRHTHVALMAEHGVPLEVISRRLGHSDSKITREIYFHVTEKLKQKDKEMVRDIKII